MCNCNCLNILHYGKTCVLLCNYQHLCAAKPSVNYWFVWNVVICMTVVIYTNLVICSMYSIVIFTVRNSVLDRYGLSNVRKVANVFHTTVFEVSIGIV